MKQAVAAITLFIALLCSGCASTVTREALMRDATRHSLTLWPDTTYYCGSKHSFDYFYIQPAGPTTFRRAHRFRVPARQNAVTDRFGYTTQRSRWRIMVGLDRSTQELLPDEAKSTAFTATPAEERTAHPPIARGSS